ncbi:hypothetical protein ACPA9J_09540 [Pseudomonas aeruginosa]
MDLGVHVVREGHRGRPQCADQARPGSGERRQALAQNGQARAVAGCEPGHGDHLHRLLHSGAAAGGRPVQLPAGPGKPCSGCCSSPPPPMSTPAGCASRCASTCAPTRASRA